MGLKSVQPKSKEGTARESGQSHSLSAAQTSQPHGIHDLLLDLQRTHGNRFVQRAVRSSLIQTKLTVSEPGDPYEVEADRVAAAVLRMPDPAAPSQPLAFGKASPAHVQRLCSNCEEDELRIHPARRTNQVALQTRRASSETKGINAALHSGIKSLRGNGHPLPHSQRAFFEPRFHRDFADVRVHTGPKAVSLTQTLNARAFTVGQDIVFSSNEYAPATPSGQKLLAHELTHVVQQSGAKAISRTETSNPPYASDSAPRISSLSNLTVPGSDGVAARQVQEERPWYAPVADVVLEAQAVLKALTDPKYFLGMIWLRLSKTLKLKLIDKAIDAALFLVDVFPGRFLIGGIWKFVEVGLKAFYGRLKSAAEDVKINAMDKLALIIAGQDKAFILAYLKGILTGFFIDGALGIFYAIRDFIKALGKLWDFLKGIGEAIGSFPDEIERLIQGFKNLGADLLANIGPVIEDLRKFITDRKQGVAFVSGIVAKGESIAKQTGEKMADSLLNFFSKPEASAQIGETVGNIIGQVLWEVVFAILTGGAGLAVTGAKLALKEAVTILAKIVGKIAGSILKLVEMIRVVFGKVVDVVKQAFTFFKGKLGELGGKLGVLLEDIREFFAMLLRNCHESKLNCNLSKGVKGAKGAVAAVVKKSKWPPAKFDTWYSKLETRSTPTKKPANRFEIEHTGEKNYLLEGGGVKFWADGVKKQTILETKMVVKPQISPYIEGSEIEDKIRAIIVGKTDKEFLRISKIISDPSNPLTSLEVITNNAKAKPLFESLMKKYNIPGEVVVK